MPTFLSKILDWLGLSFKRIPQSEIDREAQNLIIIYGRRAVVVAEDHAERSQWVKGNRDIQQRTERVLKAVRRMTYP